MFRIVVILMVLVAGVFAAGYYSTKKAMGEPNASPTLQQVMDHAFLAGSDDTPEVVDDHDSDAAPSSPEETASDAQAETTGSEIPEESYTSSNDEIIDSFTGEASWYDPNLAGNPTASGEPYDPTRYTAAHRTLTFGTQVRVTRISTGASVTVRINDRGPYTDGRIIDVSEAAAEILDLKVDGHGEVRVDILQDADG